MIKKISLLLLLVTFQGHAQVSDALDGIVEEIDFTEDSIKSIFDWVTDNIAYDVELLNSNAESRQKADNLSYVINNKKGVCWHYAILFNALCEKVGYESHIITGYTRTKEEIGVESHAWNAIKLKEEWYLYDPTWSAGYVDSSKYFKKTDHLWYKVSPAEFAYTHIPFDPIWQCQQYPYEITADNEIRVEMRAYNFEDSMVQYLDTTNVDNLNKIATRIEKYNRHLSSGSQVKYYNYLIGYYTVKMSNDYFNMAVNRYNSYLTWRRKPLKRPRHTNQELQTMLYEANDQIEQAKRCLSKSPEGYADDIVLENYAAIEQLEKYLETETKFFHKYIRTWKPLRIFLL